MFYFDTVSLKNLTQFVFFFFREKKAILVDSTNIGIVRGTVSVATIVVVSAGVEIWLL